MERGLTGEYVTVSRVGDETCCAFVPQPLPPDPPLHMDGNLQRLMDEALLALGRLDSVLVLLPETSTFIYFYIRKEAVLSSQIEGTQSSLSDLLLFESEEAPGVPLDDVQEFSSYVAAMNHGLNRLRKGFPLCTRLLREIHAVLLSKGRGSEREPGEFRRSQNWIGGTRPGNAIFVPPPHDRVHECMTALDRFLHDEPVRTPVLAKAALAHAQFETIHPFLDGNGRLGRLLIALLLCAEGALKEPMLYLSLYLKNRRQDYYDLLQLVRTTGDWEGWLRFFLEGVKDTAQLAIATARELTRLFEQDRECIQAIGKAAGSALRVHLALQQTPIISIKKAVAATNLAVPTVTAALRRLCDLAIVRELSGRRRNRIYVYSRYIAILDKGTEPL